MLSAHPLGYTSSVNHAAEGLAFCLLENCNKAIKQKKIDKCRAVRPSVM